jgi:UDP-N-acetylglucosamine 2-epimerase
LTNIAETNIHRRGLEADKNMKKQIVVIKSLRDLSPKKTVLVARSANDDENVEELEQTNFGNTSPQVLSCPDVCIISFCSLYCLRFPF